MSKQKEEYIDNYYDRDERSNTTSDDSRDEHIGLKSSPIQLYDQALYSQIRHEEKQPQWHRIHSKLDHEEFVGIATSNSTFRNKEQDGKKRQSTRK